MFQNFYPNKLIRSVYELNWKELSRTYGGVIFDIDNTLVPHGAAADEAAIQLFADGGKQALEIMAEAIQSAPAEAAGQAWGVTITPGRVARYQ